MQIRILGFLLLGLGVAFILVGMDESGSFANRFLKETIGSYPAETKWYFFGGVAMAAVGLWALLKGRFKTS